jgi:ABC-type antimicrobial peptide transport system permease subunit
LGKDSRSAQSIADRIGQHQERLSQIKQTISSAVDGSVVQIKKELHQEANLYLDSHSGTVMQDLRDFIEESLEFGGVVFDPIMRAAWDLPYMLQMAGFMLLLSLVAAIYPAVKAGRILPAEALRHH